jgi:hypothetical protein
MSRQIAKRTSTRIDWSAFTTISKMMPPRDPDEADEDEEDEEEDHADDPAGVREPDEE